MTEYAWIDANNNVRLKGTPDPAIGGSLPSPLAIPTGDSTGVTIDTTTYANKATGVGNITTLVFPADTVGFAFAIEGDTVPRWVFLSDAADGMYLTHGAATGDNFYNGSFIATDPSNTLRLMDQTGAGLVLDSGNIIAGNLPTSDPHVAGALYSTAGVVHISSG